MLHLTDICGQDTEEKNGTNGKTEAPPIEEKAIVEPVEPEQPAVIPEVAQHEPIEAVEETELAPTKVSDEDLATLHQIFGEAITIAILRLHAAVLKHPLRKAREFTAVKSDPMDDKTKRTSAHQAIRRIFSSRLDSVTESDERITIKALPPAQRGNPKGKKNSGRDDPTGGRHGKVPWNELGGEWLHFTVYKENKDTMEVLTFLGSQLKIDQKNFKFAGTKDRRAVTVQRVSVRRLDSSKLKGVARRLRNSAVGGLSYHPDGLDLGDLAGNEFVIVLRDCHFPGEEALAPTDRRSLAEKTISAAIKHFREKGFINYFGLQRFGSFTVTTDAVGLKMLKEDLKGAVDQILSFDQSALEAAQSSNASSTTLISSDDRDRAKALHIWTTSKDWKKALSTLPRKFSAETNIIRHLSRNNCGSDYQGALMSISRNLRSMYVHAYQSLVWNSAATRRWELYGDKVVEGDLVLVHEHEHKMPGYSEKDEVDQEGEVIVRPEINDRAATSQDAFERARPLTAAEVSTGQYNIFDIVLPLPGFDVEYPKNQVGEFYREFMGSERGGGLDPHNMKRKWKEISLSGGYRKVLGKPGPGMNGEVKTYRGAESQLVATDLERLKAERNLDGEDKMDVSQTADSEEEGQERLAVILQFKLGTSQYATMALRELMKDGGLVHFKPEFSGRG